MKKVTSDDLVLSKAAGGVLELDDGKFEGALRTLGLPADVQYPPDGAVLEPWQEVMVGAESPQVVGPQSSPTETSIFAPTAGAGAGAALMYLLMRGARTSTASGSEPAVAVQESGDLPQKPSGRIRVVLK
jgi:hypothetical protein